MTFPRIGGRLGDRGPLENMRGGGGPPHRKRKEKKERNAISSLYLSILYGGERGAREPGA